MDVGLNDNNTRPGMPRVLKLKNGSYIMVHEGINIKPGGGIRYKISSDGLNWGTVTDFGPLIQAGNGNKPLNTPELGYLDDGSLHGVLFVRGMYDTNMPTKFFKNTNGGSGDWQEINAPLLINKAGEKQGGYSGTLLDLGNNTLLEVNSTYNGSYDEIRSAIITTTIAPSH